jgi:hypothetical protein
MIDYVLEMNHLTKEKPNDRYARVVNIQSKTEADLAEAIARRNLGIMLEAAAEIETIRNGIYRCLVKQIKSPVYSRDDLLPTAEMICCLQQK